MTFVNSLFDELSFSSFIDWHLYAPNTYFQPTFAIFEIDTYFDCHSIKIWSTKSITVSSSLNILTRDNLYLYTNFY